jgi:hypothetical protein
MVALFHASCGLIPAFAASSPDGDEQVCPYLAYSPYA